MVLKQQPPADAEEEEVVASNPSSPKPWKSLQMRSSRFTSNHELINLEGEETAAAVDNDPPAFSLLCFFLIFFFYCMALNGRTFAT